MTAVTQAKHAGLIERLRRASIVNLTGPDHIGLEEIKGTCAEAHTALTALESDGWQPVETAPPDKNLLLGWWQTWPAPEWRHTVEFAHCTKGGWKHGQATHWQPLPAPPPFVADEQGGKS